MKRIAAHIGLTAFCALAVAFYLPENVIAYVIGLTAALAILFFLIKPLRKKVVIPVTLTVVALSFGVNLMYTAIAVKPITAQYCGEKQRIEATLTDEEYQQYSKYYYRLTTDTINGEEVHTKVLLKSNHVLEIEPFDKISFTAEVTPTENLYYLAKGYFITVNVIDMEYTAADGKEKPLYYHVIGLRQSMREAIEDYLPKEEADLCKAVLIGDKYALDEEIKDDFRYSGASYFVVVSGMHFSVLCFMSLWVFKKLFRKRWIYYPLTYLVIFLYMMITGFQPSVMRSGVMMLILITGRWALRLTDPLTSLGIAGLLMPVIFSPYGCGDIGMILSFAATFSILVWQAPIYEKIRVKKRGKSLIVRWLIKGMNAVLQIISVSLSANILVLPLSIFLFNGFSSVTLLSSLLLYALIPLMMGLTLGICVLYYLGPLRYLSLLLSWPLYGVSKLTLWIVRSLAAMPFSYIRVTSAYFYIWVAVTLVLGITAFILRRKYRLYPIVILISAMVLVGGMAVNTVVLLHTNVLEYDAGQKGAAVYLNYCGRIHLLRFDCDSDFAYQMLYQLEDSYGGVQTAVCTSYNENVNYNRMSDKEFTIRHYLMYDGAAERYGESEPEERFGGNQTIILDDGVVLETVENDGKLLFYLTDRGKTVLLIPRGFEYDAIPAAMRNVDVILLDKAGENYDQLRCETLVLCSGDQQLKQLPQYDILYTPEDKRVGIDLN